MQDTEIPSHILAALEDLTSELDETAGYASVLAFSLAISGDLTDATPRRSPGTEQ